MTMMATDAWIHGKIPDSFLKSSSLIIHVGLKVCAKKPYLQGSIAMQ